MSNPTQHRPRRPVPSPSNTVLLEAQKQWFFTDEELLRTPSLLDGMDLETEHMHRSKGVNFIMQVGMMLKLPQLTLTTAAVFMHRFFVRHHICDPPRSQGHHAYSVAAGCVLLASKVDENCRKIKEVVIACCRVAQKKPNLELDEQDKEFWKWKDTLLAYEDLALEALCFDLQLEQPHKICYDFLCYFGKNDHRLLRNAAWAFLNDCNFTVLCLLFYPRTIAAAALWAGARLCDVAFEDDEEGRPWWVQIDVNLADVQRAVSRMTELYEKNTVHRKSHQYPTISADSDGAAETTRIVNAHPIPSTDEPSADADGTSNGRKRSRDAEDESMSRTEGSSSQLRVNNYSNNSHEPSPKRQRTASPPNGLRPSSRIPAAARHRPLPRPLPVSASVNGSNTSQAGDSVDPVQQRIDEIVHQGSRNGNTNNSNNYLERDRGRDRDQNWDRDRDHERYRDHDRERDRDRDRDWDSRDRGRGEDGYGGGSDRDARRPSIATNTSTGSDTRHHHHHHQQQHHQQQPTRNGNEIPMRGQRRGAYDEEEEEGEINSDREEGEVTSTNPASTQHHADDDDDGGGGSEEGEL